jgi:MgtC family
LLGELAGQGWLQIGELALAFVLSSLIGLEREIRQKSEGLCTYTVVGFASALIILISKYGFTDILVSGQVVLDSSRIADQIVSGIGFNRWRCHLRPPGRSSWADHRGDRVAHRRGRYGLRRGAADPCGRGHRRPFHRDL